jgi:RHS repeat-associated protein
VNFTYDNASNLQTKTDNRGITATYYYDALNRPTGITYSDGTSSATFGYDAGGAAAHAIGQLTSISNGNSVTSFTNFDAVGRVTASQQQTGSVTYPAFYYWYNLAGELTKEQYPSGRTVLTSYDSAGRVSGITGLLGSNNTTYLSNVSYWPHGAVYQQQYGNNLWHSYTFNSRLQVSAQWDAIYNNPYYFLSYETYNWGTTNNNGNLQSRNEYFGGPTTFSSLQEITQSYTYDSLNRVQNFSEASSGVCGGTCSYRYYGYDRWGNQWITANGGLPNPALATTTNNYNPATNYRYDEAYDGAGNQTSVDGDNATYDAENRLRLLVNPMTGAMETFLYDGAGRRVQKSYSSHTTNYVYDALGFLAAEYSASAVSKEYIPFGSQVIAVENASGTPCQTCYLNYDHLGSVRLVTDQSANVVARHDYVPYGEEIFPPYAGRTAPFGNTDYVNPRFTGHMRDTENLLDFFNARYFGPGLGRFVSPDPMNAGADVGNPQSWNGYLYGLGNPLRFVDPSGMDTNYAGLQTGVCPASQATCPTGNPSATSGWTFPGELETAYQQYAPNMKAAFWGGAAVSLASGAGGDLGVLGAQLSQLSGLSISLSLGYQNGDSYPIATVYPDSSGLSSGPDQLQTGSSAPSNGINQHSPQSCLSQRLASSIPNSTLTGNNTYQGGHEEFGILVSGAALTSAGFLPFTSPFGNGNGYRSPFGPIHVNGQSSNIGTISYSRAVAVQGHFDVGNASLGFWGATEHTAVDVILGTLLGWIPGLHNFLDPRC